MEKIKLNLQLFGGRGSSSGGESLGSGSGEPVNIKGQNDVWSYRHDKNNEPFVDSINSSVRDMEDDFPGLMNTVRSVNATEMGGKDRTNTLGVYSETDKSVGLNTNYTNIDKMNKIYDAAVKSGFHPSRGNKNGVEAVTYHEMGHALTDHAGKKMGARDLDDAAKKVVDNAYKASKGKGGTKAWAGKISGYAQKNNAECIAEAIADCYCNGKKAAKQSQAILAELKKYK